MGAAKPAVVVHPGRHVTWYGDDTQRARAMAILTALLGSWGRKGGLFLPDARPARRASSCPDFPERKRGRADGAGDALPARLGGAGRHERPRRRDAHAASPTRSRPGSSTAQNVLESIPQPAADARGDREAGPPGRGGRAARRPDQVRRSRAARGHVPRALRPAARSCNRPSAVRRRSVSRRASRSTSRSPAGGSPRSSRSGSGSRRSSPGRRPRSTSRRSSSRWRSTPLELLNRGRRRLPRHGRTSRTGPRTTEPLLRHRRAGRSSSTRRLSKDLGADPLPRYTPPDEPPPGLPALIYGRAPVHSFARTPEQRDAPRPDARERGLAAHERRPATRASDGDRARARERRRREEPAGAGARSPRGSATTAPTSSTASASARRPCAAPSAGAPPTRAHEPGEASIR